MPFFVENVTILLGTDILVRPVPGNWVKPLPWPSPATFDRTDDLNLVLLRLFVGFHFAPPDTSLSVLDSSYQCVVGLTVTVFRHQAGEQNDREPENPDP